MSANAIRITAALSVTLLAAAAQAEYRCNPAPSPVDARACEAAQQGPEALRRFIQRMQPIINLSFHDYVNEATLVAWEANEARERAVQQSAKTASLPKK